MKDNSNSFADYSNDGSAQTKVRDNNTGGTTSGQSNQYGSEEKMKAGPENSAAAIPSNIPSNAPANDEPYSTNRDHVDNSPSGAASGTANPNTKSAQDTHYAVGQTLPTQFENTEQKAREQVPGENPSNPGTENTDVGQANKLAKAESDPRDSSTKASNEPSGIVSSIESAGAMLLSAGEIAIEKLFGSTHDESKMTDEQQYPPTVPTNSEKSPIPPSSTRELGTRDASGNSITQPVHIPGTFESPQSGGYPTEGDGNSSRIAHNSGNNDALYNQGARQDTAGASSNANGLSNSNGSTDWSTSSHLSDGSWDVIPCPNGNTYRRASPEELSKAQVIYNGDNQDSRSEIEQDSIAPSNAKEDVTDNENEYPPIKATLKSSSPPQTERPFIDTSEVGPKPSERNEIFSAKLPGAPIAERNFESEHSPKSDKAMPAIIPDSTYGGGSQNQYSSNQQLPDHHFDQSARGVPSPGLPPSEDPARDSPVTKEPQRSPRTFIGSNPVKSSDNISTQAVKSARMASTPVQNPNSDFYPNTPAGSQGSETVATSYAKVNHEHPANTVMGQREREPVSSSSMTSDYSSPAADTSRDAHGTPGTAKVIALGTVGGVATGAGVASTRPDTSVSRDLQFNQAPVPRDSTTKVIVSKEPDASSNHREDFVMEVNPVSRSTQQMSSGSKSDRSPVKEANRHPNHIPPTSSSSLDYTGQQGSYSSDTESQGYPSGQTQRPSEFRSGPSHLSDAETQVSSVPRGPDSNTLNSVASGTSGYENFASHTSPQVVKASLVDYSQNQTRGTQPNFSPAKDEQTSSFTQRELTGGDQAKGVAAGALATGAFVAGAHATREPSENNFSYPRTLDDHAVSTRAKPDFSKNDNESRSNAGEYVKTPASKIESSATSEPRAANATYGAHAGTTNTNLDPSVPRMGQAYSGDSHHAFVSAASGYHTPGTPVGSKHTHTTTPRSNHQTAAYLTSGNSRSSESPPRHRTHRKTPSSDTTAHTGSYNAQSPGSHHVSHRSEPSSTFGDEETSASKGNKSFTPKSSSAEPNYALAAAGAALAGASSKPNQHTPGRGASKRETSPTLSGHKHTSSTSSVKHSGHGAETAAIPNPPPKSSHRRGHSHVIDPPYMQSKPIDSSAKPKVSYTTSGSGLSIIDNADWTLRPGDPRIGGVAVIPLTEEQLKLVSHRFRGLGQTQAPQAPQAAANKQHYDTQIPVHNSNMI